MLQYTCKHHKKHKMYPTGYSEEETKEVNFSLDLSIWSWLKKLIKKIFKPRFSL